VINDELEELFGEVLALAATLRRSTLAARASDGLSLPALAVLRLLQQQSGLTVPQLARQRGTSRQNCQVLVDRLATAGLLDYIANPDHRRSERIQLTAAGRRSLAAANRQVAAKLPGLLSHVTEEEVRICSNLLERIQGKLGGRQPRTLKPPRRQRSARTGVTDATPVVVSVEVSGHLQEEPPDASPPEELPFNLL
jgi:DNA-binding MarR family transcriptional regulator